MQALNEGANLMIIAPVVYKGIKVVLPVKTSTHPSAKTGRLRNCVRPFDALPS